jgi:hypothetical protein
MGSPWSWIDARRYAVAFLAAGIVARRATIRLRTRQHQVKEPTETAPTNRTGNAVRPSARESRKRAIGGPYLPFRAADSLMRERRLPGLILPTRQSGDTSVVLGWRLSGDALGKNLARSASCEVTSFGRGGPKLPTIVIPARI